MQLAHAMTRNKRATGIVVVVVVVVVAFFAYWFGPWHLFVNRTADEALPGAPAVVDAGGGQDGDAQGGALGGGDAPAPKSVLAEGTFRSLAHESSGTAKLIEADGATFLRFEQLDVLSGPDLRVYLTAAPADADASAFGEERLVVDLGGLRANQGNLTYEIPAGVPVDDVRSVSIWCRRFSVGFGVAPLDAAA